MNTKFEYSSQYKKDLGAFSASFDHNDSYSDEMILETIFSMCNYGSRKEHDDFLKSAMPSLSVGDTVVLFDPLRTYSCKSVGWEQIA